MADLSGIGPIFIFYRALRYGTVGEILRRKLLRGAVIASCLTAMLGIGIIPGTRVEEPLMKLDSMKYNSDTSVDDLVG